MKKIKLANPTGEPVNVKTVKVRIGFKSGYVFESDFIYFELNQTEGVATWEQIGNVERLTNINPADISFVSFFPNVEETPQT